MPIRLPSTPVWLCAAALAVAGVVLMRPSPHTPDSPPPPTGRPPPPHLPQNTVPHTNQDSQLRDIADDWESLAARTPDAALHRLLAIGDPDLRTPALTAIARGWARHDPHAAARWIQNLGDPEEQVSATLGLVPQWTKSQPQACLDWVKSQPPGNLREVSLVELADAWTERSAADALHAFLSLPSEAGTERGLHAILSQWALDDPQGALDELERSAPTARRDEFLETALVSLTNRDPDLAWREATRCHNPAHTTHVRAMALEAMAESRPHDALRLATSTGPTPPAWLHAITRGWSTLDTTATHAWIATLPDESLRKELQQTIAEQHPAE